MSPNKKSSSIPFVEPNQLETRPSYDSSSSSSRVNHHSSTLPRKKKESILHKFSVSSRRSLSWLPGLHDSNHRQQQSQEHQPHAISASSGASTSSRSSTDQNNRQPQSHETTHSNSNMQLSTSSMPSTQHTSIPSSNIDQSTQVDRHTSKTSIAKGIRNVARTVKKSLTQFERPRSITGDQFDRIPNHNHPDSKVRNSFQHQNKPHNSYSTNIRNSHPPSPSQRIRAQSTSEVYGGSSNRSRDSQINQPSQPLDRSSPAQPFEPGGVTPSSSPQSLPKKPRPQSAAELQAFPSTRISNRQQHEHLSWRAQVPVGSLPMAASLLAAPSPPPVDHSTFLAIIPGQKPNSVVLGLSVTPPPVSQSVEAPALTGVSMGVEPALSRRVSLTSTPGVANSINDKGFIFIQTPSSKSNTIDPSPSIPSSPAPSGQLGSERYEIVGKSTTLESFKSRPPLVSASTTISLVQSCIAERGSINELDETTKHEQSLGYQVTEPHEDLTRNEPDNSTNFPESTTGYDYANSESRKRKVTSMTLMGPNDDENKLDQTGFDSSEVIFRQHKVLRSTDQPFSSSTTSTAIGRINHGTSHPLSLLTVNQTSTSTTTITTQHLTHRLKSQMDQSNNLSCSDNNQRNSKHRKNSTKSKVGYNKNLSSISRPSNRHRPDHNRNGNEIWNMTIVSTVVGVVIIAAVLISSTNFSNLNGKSWIGNLVKKI